MFRDRDLSLVIFQACWFGLGPFHSLLNKNAAMSNLQKKLQITTVLRIRISTKMSLKK